MPTVFTAAEHCYMRRAWRLAALGRGHVEPNPMVGCVLVREGRVVGEGHHRRFGGPHAEVVALRRAAGEAAGATAYVTLEPCCHHGKTPACTEALINAGVSRVVAAMGDPFPAVDGGGIRRLRRSGVRVDVGLLHGEARELNAPYLTLLTNNRPYVILKWAQSLDGKIATRTGDSRWISSPPARRLVHRLRARVDAILVGVDTVRSDDPLLTARDVPVRRTAARVIVDSRLRVPPEAAVIRTARSTPTLILTTRKALSQRAVKGGRLRRAGAEVVACRTREGRVDLLSALSRLGERRFTNVLAEGGGRVLGALMDGGLADEAWVFVAPRLIGGDGSISALGGRGARRVSDAPCQSDLEIRRVATDILYRMRLRHADI